MSPSQKAAARSVFAVWTNGDLDALDAVVAPDVVHHDPYDPHGAHGLAGMKQSIADRRRAYPDLTFTIERQVAEDDTVATHWTAGMTHDGKRVTLSGITIDRFADGKIVEAWRVIDMLGFRRQIGAPSSE
ncbi:ester cyclase [Cryptosporangium minutisporangium]|uniref:Ester cyclase n=1 Tax=Cryptosporangium minutisporangium TaxID=113569 RepID=A0ABP6SPQ9_9ACTN